MSVHEQIIGLYNQYCNAYMEHQLKASLYEPKPPNHWQQFYAKFPQLIAAETLSCDKSGESDQVYEFLARKAYEKIDKKLKFDKSFNQ